MSQRRRLDRPGGGALPERSSMSIISSVPVSSRCSLSFALSALIAFLASSMLSSSAAYTQTQPHDF